MLKLTDVSTSLNRYGDLHGYTLTFSDGMVLNVNKCKDSFYCLASRLMRKQQKAICGSLYQAIDVIDFSGVEGLHFYDDKYNQHLQR